MGENVLKLKSFDFAVRIVRLCRFLQTDKREYVLSKQLLRCGTSIGSMVPESEHAESKADFIHKLAVAQKESNETLYWIELLSATEYLTDSQASSMLIDATELLKMLTSSIKTAKINH